MKKILKEFNDKTLFETQNDFDFFHRVFNDGDLSKYQNSFHLNHNQIFDY